MEYKDLKLEEIEKAVKEVDYNPFVKDLGNGLYRIGSLTTNKAGLILYDIALKTASEEYLKNLNKQYE